MCIYRVCIIHLDMYTHNGHTVGPCTQIIASGIHSISKTRGPRYLRVVNMLFSKKISLRYREPAIEIFNKPNL